MLSHPRRQVLNFNITDALTARWTAQQLTREPEIAAYLRETVDIWNDGIERWTHVTGTPWAKRFNVGGYHIRIAPVESVDGASPPQDVVSLKIGREPKAPHPPARR